MPYAVCCAILGVSSSWAYKWLDRPPPTARQQRRGELDAEVLKMFKASKGTYGSPRIHADLVAAGWAVSVNTVAESMPAELDRREKRLARLQAARAQIEAEATDKARQQAEAAERRRQDRTGVADEEKVTEAGQKAAASATPKPTAQANFTDPESRIMKTGTGAFMQAYNAQAVVDDAHQIITAADVTDCASDVGCFTEMLDQSATNTGTHPKQAVVDAGYCCEANLDAAAARQAEHGTDTFMATGRLRRDEQVPPAPRGRIPATTTLKQRMARKLRTKPGRAAYARRKTIVEPVFGQITTVQNGRRFLLRGIDGARGEWRLLSACHHLLKVFRQAGTAGLTTATG